MTEEIESAVANDVVDSDTSMKKPRRSWFSTLVLWLFVLAALTVGSATAWQVFFVDSAESGDLKTEMEKLSRNHAADLQSLTAEFDDQRNDFINQFSDLDESLNVVRSRLVASVRELKQGGSEDTGAWKIAEAEYLLRVANYQLALLRDHESALKTLEVADSILRELDDFTLSHVREAIALERQSLKNIETVDVQGLYFELEALKNSVRQVTFMLPKFVKDAEELGDTGESLAVEESDQSWWSVALDEVASLIRIRHHEAEVARPLLSSLDVAAIRERLMLAIEKAQYALLYREEAIYQQTLGETISILETHAAVEDLLTSETISRLEELSKARIQYDLPDISGSLNAIRGLASENVTVDAAETPESPETE